MEAGEAVGTDCVDRHTFFITQLSSVETQICLRAHYQPSPSHSHGQPGQLGRCGWAENHPLHAPPTAPCARRRPAQHRKAVASEGGASSRGASRRELEVVEGVQGHQAPCRTPPATPRTLPNTRNMRPMRLAKPQVAAPPPSMRTRRGAPPSHRASRLCAACCGVTGGGS